MFQEVSKKLNEGASSDYSNLPFRFWLKQHGLLIVNPPKLGRRERCRG